MVTLQPGQTPKAHNFGIFLNQDNEVLSVTNEMEDFNIKFTLLVRISQKISTIEKQNKNILGDVGYEGKSQTDEN